MVMAGVARRREGVERIAGTEYASETGLVLRERARETQTRQDVDAVLWWSPLSQSDCRATNLSEVHTIAVEGIA